MLLYSFLMLIRTVLPVSALSFLYDSITYHFNTKTIVLSAESKMFLFGKTNINSYQCDCANPPSQMPISYVMNDYKLVFNEFSLDVSTQKINCHQDLYNYNIKKTLEAENYPFITINLMEAWKSDNSSHFDDTGWFNVTAKTNIIIKNLTRIENVEAMAFKISPNKYRIKGCHELHMSDYNLVNPNILFGLIKVEDKLFFNFDLIFEVI